MPTHSARSALESSPTSRSQLDHLQAVPELQAIDCRWVFTEKWACACLYLICSADACVEKLLRHSLTAHCSCRPGGVSHARSYLTLGSSLLGETRSRKSAPHLPPVDVAQS